MSKIPMLAALVAAFTANAQIAVPTDIRAKVPAPQPADWWSRSFEERQKKIGRIGLITFMREICSSARQKQSKMIMKRTLSGIKALGVMLCHGADKSPATLLPSGDGLVLLPQEALRMVPQTGAAMSVITEEPRHVSIWDYNISPSGEHYFSVCAEGTVSDYARRSETRCGAYLGWKMS